MIIIATLCTAVPLCLGVQQGIPETGDGLLFGDTIKLVGDVDGDGCDDYVVSDPFYTHIARGGSAVDNPGALWVISGKEGTALARFLGDRKSGGLGFGMKSLWDGNGDGIRDIVAINGGDIVVLSGADLTAILSIPGSFGAVEPLGHGRLALAHVKEIDDQRSKATVEARSGEGMQTVDWTQEFEVFGTSRLALNLSLNEDVSRLAVSWVKRREDGAKGRKWQARVSCLDVATGEVLGELEYKGPAIHFAPSLCSGGDLFVVGPNPGSGAGDRCVLNAFGPGEDGEWGERWSFRAEGVEHARAIGDIDGDHVVDFAACAPGLMFGGKVHLISGATGELIHTLSGGDDGTGELNLGSDVCAADVNGDGQLDLVIGNCGGGVLGWSYVLAFSGTDWSLLYKLQVSRGRVVKY
jgi:FG-GAP repeat